MAFETGHACMIQDRAYVLAQGVVVRHAPLLGLSTARALPGQARRQAPEVAQVDT